MYYFHVNTGHDNKVPGGMGYWIGSLASAFRKGLEHELAPFDVTPTQWAILEMCYRGEANTVSGLARVIPVDAAAISRQLDKLGANGLIHRRRSTRDRRSITVRLTQEGRELAVKLAPCERANNTKFTDGITDEELTALINTIRKMLTNGGVADHSTAEQEHKRGETK